MIAPSAAAESRVANSGAVTAASIATGAAPAAFGADPAQPSHIPTIWGLKPLDLHDRFWASRAIQVVRPGDGDVAEHAQFYLLMEPGALALFDPTAAEEELSDVAPGEAHLIYIRVHDT